MDSSACNRTLPLEVEDTSVRNVSVESSPQLTQRLKAAAEFAANEANSQGSTSLAVFISDLNECSIVVDEVSSLKSSLDRDYFIIYKTYKGDPVPLFKAPIGKYRYVYFRNVNNSRIFVKTKLLKVFFHDCTSTQISLRKPVIGAVEFFRCKSVNLSVRIDEEDPIPLTRLEECKDFHILQSTECLEYIVKSCVDVSGTIVDRITGKRGTRYELGKIFWDEQEQVLICLSRRDGFAAASYTYALNDLSQHIIALPPGPSEESRNSSTPSPSPSETVFGTTPPMGDMWMSYLAQRSRR